MGLSLVGAMDLALVGAMGLSLVGAMDLPLVGAMGLSLVGAMDLPLVGAIEVSLVGARAISLAGATTGVTMLRMDGNAAMATTSAAAPHSRSPLPLIECAVASPCVSLASVTVRARPQRHTSIRPGTTRAHDGHAQACCTY
jgi:hypothetical protein